MFKFIFVAFLGHHSLKKKTVLTKEDFVFKSGYFSPNEKKQFLLRIKEK